ncbi:hypothetical protein EYR41_009542 [Orbilia oligospora]|uniref:Uncharacterized protein n=1 Tax=Orbilia oligospora TaxID=2813651 RepID=A0A7C8KET8_ORBOL|nr:hypothetical protein TWF751_006261 [Orbilia oligospora]TGJ65586.1 hypothetical protein EYR41_009542 [Orbilia oligospora]
MASTKNRGTYRAVGLDKNTTKSEFESLLIGYLTPAEKATLSISKLCLAPYPIDHGRTQTAIFKFTGGSPEFLKKKHIKDKRGATIEIDSDFWGLTQLYHTEGEIQIDIVALTGLNAHAYGSWSGATDDDTNPMWLQDYLSKDTRLGPHCRSMIYGYNAKTAANASHDTNDYVKGFLHELKKARKEPKEKKRPLVLLGHSYGGLIIAHAFTRASWDLRYRSIYHSIIRIICFGVPYRGISLEDVDRQVNSNPKKFSQGIELLKAIAYEAGRITANTEQFRHLLKQTKTRLVTFYETAHTRKVEQITRDGKVVEGEFSRCGEYTIVVSRDSAVLGLGEDLEEDHPTEGDHSTIVKFTSETNSTYTTITEILRTLLRDGEKEVKKRINATEGEDKRQDEIADAIGTISQNPEEVKYMCSQMLRIAADAGLHRLAEKLLKKGADPNMQAHDPQYRECREDSRWLFDSAYDPETEEEAAKVARYKNSVAEILESDVTALALATKRGNTGLVKLLLKGSADPNLQCSSYLEGRTPLHEACRRNHSDIVKCLLRYGANPNAKTGLFETAPLHEVAEHGGFVAPTLLVFRADVNAKKLGTGDTPLHIAARRGHVGAVYEFQKHGADVAARNASGSTPLHGAAEDGRTSVVLSLLAEPRNRGIVDIQNNEGETALHKAIESEELEIIRMLLDKGANKGIVMKDGKDAFELAAEIGNDEVEALLKKY